MKKLFNILIAMSFICAAQSPVLAADLPYSQSGTVEDIDYETNRAIISDLTLNISPSVLINTPRGKKIGIDNIKVGMSVGYNIPATGNSGSLKEVWIFDGKPVDHTINDD